MKGDLIGQAFMLPSYSLIAAAIWNNQNMTLFLTLMGLSFVAGVGSVLIAFHWINRRRSA